MNNTAAKNAPDIIDDADELIPLRETLRIMGDIPTSTAYSDAALMALKINMTAEGRCHTVRFIKRQVLALRAQRVARAQARAAEIVAAVEAKNELRRARQRRRAAELYAAKKAASTPEPALKVRTRKVRLTPRALTADT